MRQALFNYYKYGVLGNAIRLEASSLCQLRCPSCVHACERGKEIFGKVIGQNYLRLKDFRKILDDNPWIKCVELSNLGEIFLNPELREIIEYAHSKTVLLSAGTGVNLNAVSEEVMECLVKHNFQYITVAIDGASEETYRIYRRGGDFRKVLENVRRINFYKEKHGKKNPVLCWQFVIFGHNEHELPMARRMARDLNMEFRPKLQTYDWNPSYSPVQNKDFVAKEIGFEFATREEFERKYKRNYFVPCAQLWTTPQINWDGKLLGCCFNIWSDFGNVFEEGLTECVKGERYRYAKRMLLGKEDPRDDIACSACPRYKNRSLPWIIKRFL